VSCSTFIHEKQGLTVNSEYSNNTWKEDEKKKETIFPRGVPG